MPFFLPTGHLTFQGPEGTRLLRRRPGVHAIYTWLFGYRMWKKRFVAHQKFELTVCKLELPPRTTCPSPPYIQMGPSLALSKEISGSEDVFSEPGHLRSEFAFCLLSFPIHGLDTEESETCRIAESQEGKGLDP